MDVKKSAMDQLMKLMQNPKVMEIATHPKVMETVMKAMALRGKVSSVTTAASNTVARSLHLATREEVRELRRTIRRLQEQVNEMEHDASEDPDADGER